MRGARVRPAHAVRVAGVVTGLVGFAVLAVATRLPAGPTVLGADVTISIAPTGELGVDPAGPMFIEAGLRPGQDPREHRTQVHNRTGKPLVVTVRSRPSGDDLDGALRIQLHRDGEPIWNGAERDLRLGADFTLQPGTGVRLGVAASVGADTPHWSGRVVNVDLVLSSAVTS